MITLLLIPTGICLVVAFLTAGVVLQKNWSAPNVLYSKTVAALRSKLLEDKNGRYLYQRYAIWCSVTDSRMTPEGYALLSLCCSVIGFGAGLLIGNIVVSLSLFVLLLISPTLILFARYIVRVNKMIRSFAHFVDLFTRHYSSRKNIVLAFRDMVADCPKDLQGELILLNNTMADGTGALKAIESFAERINHVWAHDFSMYITSGLEGETADIQSALNRLTSEMFIEQGEREERRSEIYGIWISLILVIIISLLLIPYNHTLLKDTYRLYFLTPDGQALLSLAVTVWSLSILLAFIWGRRHG
ncbi:hypothetical protein LOK74_21650 [Brevibacillus humidisoli]|uniref:hypothetical protein n=1 Tax=Brevibacillus humidisoli TaxID=2895522 RepID=UPI001E3825F2|nr:hypothetical protein [Brevibacillus humidisoli]UFJ40592.1 hypothetical protein LOK74_21650 [Brevibacillus humidisoli]